MNMKKKPNAEVVNISNPKKICRSISTTNTANNFFFFYFININKLFAE